MGFYLLYDHLDHLLDELDDALRTRGHVQAYIKIQEYRTAHAQHTTLATAIILTWIQQEERIIHAARIPVDQITCATDDPQRAAHEEQLRQRSRVARKLAVAALNMYGIRPGHNLLLTAGLWADLAQLETEQLLWRIQVRGSGAHAARQIVPLEELTSAETPWEIDHPFCSTA